MGKKTVRNGTMKLKGDSGSTSPESISGPSKPYWVAPTLYHKGGSNSQHGCLNVTHPNDPLRCSNCVTEKNRAGHLGRPPLSSLAHSSCSPICIFFLQFWRFGAFPLVLFRSSCLFLNQSFRPYSLPIPSPFLRFLTLIYKHLHGSSVLLFFL